MIDPKQERLTAALRKLARVEAKVRSSLGGDRAAIVRFARGNTDIAANEDDLRAADAFVQRFEQLFEIVLRRLFPATIRIVGVGGRADSIIEILVQLEQLEFIADAKAWVARKDLRDRLVHEYPDDPDARRIDLLAALASAEAILVELERFRGRLSRIPGFESSTHD